MSGKDNINKEDLIKSLSEASGISLEEAALLINEDALLKAKGSEEEEEKEDEYSEDKEKEMEKAMNDSKEAYETYKGKKPQKEVQKSVEQDLGTKQEPENNDLLKSFGDMFGNFSKSLEKKLEKSQEQSQDQVNSLQEELVLMKSQIEEIGNFTPPAKSANITNQAIIEKAIESGVEEEGKIHYSATVHKEKVSDLLIELMSESEGELLKALDTDLSNYVAGSGILGNTAKRLLSEKKNVVVR